LAEAALTFDEAVKIILSVEAAEKNASVLVSSDHAGAGGQLQWQRGTPHKKSGGSPHSHQGKGHPTQSNNSMGQGGS